MSAYSQVAASTYRPPFNKVSRFRDPGRVNINTVFDDPTGSSYHSANAILSALFKGMPSMDPDPNAPFYSTTGPAVTFVNNLRLSRQGYSGTLFTSSTGAASIFANPMRAQDASDLLPGINPSTGLPLAAAVPPVEAGLLRSMGPLAMGMPGATANPNPLLAYTSAGSGYDYQDTNRNPYFRYQQYQKVGNLLSTQSNCFAMWVTVGYFEVEENRVTSGTLAGTIAFDTAHPDGYSLGAEVGIDSGNVSRHRGFFIIDRSIPVGFNPGSKLNTDDCVLVRRIIE
jgi:hypothetical protein